MGELRQIRHAVEGLAVDEEQEFVSGCIVIERDLPLKLVILQFKRKEAGLCKFLTSCILVLLFDLELHELALLVEDGCDDVPFVVEEGVELDEALFRSVRVYNLVAVDMFGLLCKC